MPDTWTLAALIAKWVLYSGGLFACGTVFCAVMFRTPNVRRFAMICSVTGLAAAVAGFALKGAALTGDASGLTDPDMLGLLWGTTAGTAFRWQIAGLITLLAGLVLRGKAGTLAALAGALGVIISFSVTGHIADRNSLALTLLLLAHLTFVALWAGILVPLRRTVSKPDGGVDAADLGHRFGRLAVIFVPLLICAGFVMAWRLTGSLAALFGTGYGQTLLYKVLGVAVLLGFAALNKQRFVPALQTGDARDARGFSASITVEIALVLAILLATAIATTTQTLPS